MNKAELIEAVANKSDLTKASASRAIEAFVEAIVSTVAEGKSVSIPGLGTFKATERSAREGKNPKTGEKIQIAASTVPKFTAGANFKTKVANKA